MRRALTIIVMLWVVSIANGQSIENWFITSGGKLADHGRAVAVDREGNVYVTGSFQAYSYFGEWRLQTRGDTDIFLSKYSSKGDLMWVRSAGGFAIAEKTITESGTDILVSGNYVYITGVFSGTASFDGTDVKSSGNDDIFLAKYSLQGDLQWVRSAGGPNQDIATALSSDKSGNIFMVGNFQESAVFGNQTVRTSVMLPSIFLSKYDSSGLVLWTRNIGIDGITNASALLCMDTHCYVSGTHSQGNVSNAFLARYDINGGLQDVLKLKGSDEVTIDDIKTLHGELFIAGSFNGTLQIKRESMSSKGQTDVYIAKLNKKGDFNWVRTFGGTEIDNGVKLGVSENGQILFVGRFQGELEMDEGNLISEGNDDIFFISLTPKGDVNWANQFGGDGQDQVMDVEVLNDDLYITGHFRSLMQINGRSYMSSGLSDMFISRTALQRPITENLEESAIGRLFPNPAKDEINIELLGSVLSLKIYDSIGRCIYEIDEKKTDDFYARIDVRAFKPGLYIVKYMAEGRQHETKFLKI